MKSAYGCRAIIAVQPGIQGSPVREHIILLPADNPSRNSIHPGGGRCTEHLDVLSEAYAAGGSNARLSQPGVCRSPV